MDALRCPPGDADVATLSGGEVRRVAALPAPAPEAGHAAARRADQPPRRGERGVARALPQGVSGHGGGHHPRSLLPRQRRGLDPRARPRRGHPVGGQLLVVARAEARAPRRGGEAGVGAPAHARARARVGAHVARARQAKSKARLQALRDAARRGRQERDGAAEIIIPPGPRLGDVVVAGRASLQGLRRPPARSRISTSACPAAASWASSAPTARARPRCSA